jgi:hypothetical protein
LTLYCRGHGKNLQKVLKKEGFYRYLSNGVKKGGEVEKVELGIRKAEGGIKKRLGERETGG